MTRGAAGKAFVGTGERPSWPRCEVLDSVADVKLDWTRLSAPAGVYQSPEWLEACERLAPGPARFVVARSGRAPVGLLPLFLLPASEAGIYDPAASLGPELAAEVAGPSVLVAGARAGYRTGFAIDREHAAGREAEVVTALLAAADDVARDLDADSLTIQYLRRTDADLLVGTRLVEAGEVVLQLCEAEIPLPGRSFDDYVGALSSGRRATVRRDLATFAASGLRLAQLRLSEALDFAPRLLARLNQRHGGGVDEDLARAMLTNQATSLDRLSVVFAAEEPEGETVAYSLAYRCGDTLYLRLVGLDHERAEPTGAYFEVMFYAPLRFAYAEGLRAMHLGVKSLRPKVLRGGRLAELFGVFRGRDGRRLSAAQAGRVSLRNARAIVEEVGSLSRDRIEPFRRST